MFKIGPSSLEVFGNFPPVSTPEKPAIFDSLKHVSSARAHLACASAVVVRASAGGDLALHDGLYRHGALADRRDHPRRGLDDLRVCAAQATLMLITPV